MALRKPLKWQLMLVSACAVGIVAPAGAETPWHMVLAAAQGKNPGENALLIVDPVAKQVVARVPLSGQPHNITVSPDGKIAYTSNAIRGTDAKNFPGGSETLPSDSISVVDLAAKKEVRVVNVGAGANPHGIWFAAGKVYYTAEGSKTVGRYDPKQDIVDWIGGVGQNRVHELVVSRDGSKIFTANIGSDNVAMIASWDPQHDVLTAGDRPPPWNVTVIPTGHGAEGIDITPDEKEVWVLNGHDSSISVIDVDTRKVVHTIELNTDGPLRITLTPDGKLALVPSGTAELLVVDTKSRKLIKKIPSVGTRSHGVVVSPDSRFAYVAAQGEAEIAVVDLRSFTVTARIPTGTGTKAFDGIDGMGLVQRK
jgi:YVTN family beta-propeller protein